MTSRRGALARLSLLAAAVGLSGCSRYLSPRGVDESGVAGLEPNPHDLPRRQFAINRGLRTGPDGNPLPPRHHHVLLLNLREDPSDAAARTVERAMRTIEDAYEWNVRGLFHLLAWGSAYFERIDQLGAGPIDHPRRLSRADDPELLAFDAALVLRSDVPSHLAATVAAMFGDRDELAGVPVEARLGEVFEVAGHRTGFIGEGLPAAHTAAEGVPDAVPEDAPMFTGFFSGRRGTQASEDRVARSGPLGDGTIMHLSHLTESLDNWWTAMDEGDRVAQMFSPEFSPDDVAAFETDVPFSDAVRKHAREFGLVGHHEKVAQAREGGEPLLLRRDFNTTDGGQAGVHFLALQRELAHFRKTRRAMNGWFLRDDHPDIGAEENNGLVEFITVESRANFYVPPRSERAFPLR